MLPILYMLGSKKESVLNTGSKKETYEAVWGGGRETKEWTEEKMCHSKKKQRDRHYASTCT